MRSSALRLLAILFASALLASASWVPAFSAPAGPVIAMHARTTVGKNPCDWPPDGPCSDYVLEMPTHQSLFVYVVAAGVPAADGISEASFQVLYDPDVTSGFDLFGWSACGNLEFPVNGYRGPWPSSGSGNRVVWPSCQSTEVAPDGVHAVAGYFYVYAYGADTFSLVGPPIPGFAAPRIVTCGGAPLPLASAKTATVAAGSPLSACNPCVGPCPDVDFLPCGLSTTQLDFGEVAVGNSKDLTVTVTNVSAPSINVSVDEACAEFSVVDPPASFALAYGESRDVTVRFTPAAAGPRTCVLLPCGTSVFAWGAGTDGVPVERSTWGRIKTTYGR